MDKLKVVLIAANPEKENLRLSAEQRDIQERVELAEYRRQKYAPAVPAMTADFIAVGATRVRDLVAALQLHEPQILHFSGHGAAAGELIFEDDHGGRLPVSPEDMAAILGEFADSLRLVFLNACYSETLARAIGGVIDIAVGMASTIGDGAAPTLAAAFYAQLLQGGSVGRAFRLACREMAIEPAGNEYRQAPRLVVRAARDADQIFFTRESCAPDKRLSDRADLDDASLARLKGLLTGPLTPGLLRSSVNKMLPMDAVLHAFLVSKCPAIAKQVSDNMQRTVKLNLLFTYERDLQLLHRKLIDFCEAHADEVGCSP